MSDERIFISHASEDGALADRIVAYLETRGVPCWISSRDIPPRAIYSDAIVEGMQSCGACAVLISVASNASKAVKREVELASHEEKAFIPIRIDGSEPTSGLAYYLRNSHWIDFGRDGNRALDRIVARDSVKTKTTTKVGEAKVGTRISLIVALVAALALTSAIFVAYRAATPESNNAQLIRDTPPSADIIALSVQFGEGSFWLGDAANAIALAAQERRSPPIAAAIAPACADALSDQRATAVFTALRRGGLQPYQIYTTSCSNEPNTFRVALDWDRHTTEGLRRRFVGRWDKVSGDTCVANTFEFGSNIDGFYWAANDEFGPRMQAVGSAARVGPRRIQIGAAAAMSTWAFEESDGHIQVFDLEGDSAVPICRYRRQRPNIGAAD